ncbi:uncharacterized protein EI90DRAFT_2936039, partial [Cantharellus anzutake]|uniref:uncharacterized protein n=1 Tax=Cantharellus anzutake TaxID=1750568 RepID=UPI00190341DC
TQHKPGLLHQLPIPETPWSSISMDFVGPFPMSMGLSGTHPGWRGPGCSARQRDPLGEQSGHVY